MGQLAALALVVRLVSPNGTVALEVSHEGGGPLSYAVLTGRDVVVEPSMLGIVVDAKNLADGVTVGRTEPYSIDETYPWYGVHETAVNRCRGERIGLTHTATRTAWTLEARACDDGAAFRYLVPGDAGAVRTPDEATTFRWPAGAVVWSHDFEGHYEGVHTRHEVGEVPAGEWAAAPLTVKLLREGVYGLEHRQMPEWARHNTTLPFTRFLAGAGDYTPVVFGERRKETSWAHQIATALVFTSPVLVFGGHPQSLLENPAVELIRSLPSVWDETIVLPSSEIGELAAFARRRGRSWFVAVLNGTSARQARIDLAFLTAGHYDALVVKDEPGEAAAVKVEQTTIARGAAMTVDLRAGGGFIARFSPRN